MSMLMYDIRQGRRWIAGWLIALLLFFTACITAVGVWHKFFNPAQDLMTDGGELKVGVEAYATGTFEVFECISRGQECPEFDSATESMSSMATTFTYTPIEAEGAPGTSNSDGTRSVMLDELSKSEWQTVGKAVTRDGDLPMQAIQPDRFKISGSDAAFTVPARDGEPALKGTVTVEHSGSAEEPENVQVTAVTYGDG